MKVLLFSVVCLFSGLAIAKPKIFDLDIKLSLEGTAASYIRILVEEGKTGSVTQEINGQTSHIEVNPTVSQAPNGDPAIRLSFLISEIAADGSQTIISKPQLFAKAGETAQITLADDQGKETMALSVLANEVTKHKFKTRPSPASPANN